MNILYIDHYAGSPRLGMELRPYYIAREWVKAGHSVTIAAASFSHLRREQPPAGPPYSPQHIDGIRYVWLRSPKYGGNGISRIINILAFLVRLRCFRDRGGPGKYDAVIASSTYPFDNLFLPAGILGKAHCRIFEVHDLWPLSPMELGGYGRFHPFIVATGMAEKHALAKCDAVVSLLPDAGGYMESRGLGPGKFHHVPNGVAVDEWAEGGSVLPEPMAARFRGLPPGSRIVGYVGGHAVSNALDTFIEAGKAMPGFTFVLVGKGDEKERLEERAKGHPNIVFMDPVPKHLVPEVLRRMDILYLGWRDLPLYRYGISPNKLFEYMMAGKPVIHASGASNDPCAEAGCGIRIRPERVDDLERAILEMASMESGRLEEMGRKGREYVLAHNDYSVLAARFIGIIEKALRSGTTAR